MLYASGKCKNSLSECIKYSFSLTLSIESLKFTCETYITYKSAIAKPSLQKFLLTIFFRDVKKVFIFDRKSNQRRRFYDFMHALHMTLMSMAVVCSLVVVQMRVVVIVKRATSKAIFTSASKQLSLLFLLTKSYSRTFMHSKRFNNLKSSDPIGQRVTRRQSVAVDRKSRVRHAKSGLRRRRPYAVLGMRLLS